MKNKYHIVACIAVLFSAFNVIANDTSEALIFQAMSDEMARSMSTLSYEDYKAPFFISYYVTENSKHQITANLGSIIESNSDQSIYCNARIMVGSYALNDEKFNDKVNRAHYNDGGFPSLEKPDYYGIRRSLWLKTNNVYKSASEKYKNKCDLMEKEGLSLDDLSAPDFSQEAKVEYIEAPLPNEKDIKTLKTWAKDISLAFEPYKDLVSSSLSLKYANQTRYMLNSEGTKAQIPSRLYNVVITAKLLSPKNKPISQSLKYYADSYENLPTKAQFKEDIDSLISNLYALRQATEYIGRYNGPIMIQDQAVLYRSLISLVRRGTGILANPRGMVNDKSKGLSLNSFFTWEDMKGKNVIDKSLSVYALPTRSHYNGTALLGQLHCDTEGVMPPDSISLIDKGIVKNQLINRTPTPSQQQSNGHQVTYFKKGSMGSQLGVSVIKVDAEKSFPSDSLYQRLKKLAQDEGLQHAIVLRPLQCHANEAPINVYQIDLATGQETLLAGTSYFGKTADLKKIAAISSNHILSNTIAANQSYIDSQRKKIEKYPSWIKEIIMLQYGDEGAPASFIYPDAILLESVTVNGSSKKSKSKAYMVSSPLALQ